MQIPSINDGDYLEDQSERFLLKLLRMFSPGNDKLAFGSSYWRICRGVLELGGERFCFDDLEKAVNEDPTFGKEQLPREEVSSVLERLKENGFLDADPKGFKLVPPETADVLNEFFGFNAKPGTGKIGFAKYLAKSQKRLMMWYCLHEPHVLTREKAAKITGYPKQKCRELLEMFSRKKWLRRACALVDLQTYHLLDGNAIFGELLSEYSAYCLSVSSTDINIIFVLRHYAKVSGKMIREDLEEAGIKCDPKTVYNHMKTLEKEGILKPTGESKKVRGAHEEFYSVNLKDSEKYGRSLISDIKKRIEKSSLHVSNEFYEYLNKQKPNELITFWQSLRWGFVMRSLDQTSTLPLWRKLLEELHPKVLSPMLSVIRNIPPEDPDEKLKAISNKYRVSPLITSILYYSICKFSEKDTETRKNQQ